MWSGRHHRKYSFLFTSTSESVHTSSAVLADLENVGDDFGISLLSYVEVEILCYFISTSGNDSHLWLTICPPFTLTSESSRTSCTVLADLENMGITFGVSLLSCIQAVIRYKYFKVIDRHLGFSTSGFFPFSRTLLQLFPLGSCTPKT